MEFTINRNIFLKALGHANGIIEKKTTFPILSNILIVAKDSKIKITATDLDIIYSENITPIELRKEGSTTTSANVPAYRKITTCRNLPRRVLRGFRVVRMHPSRRVSIAPAHASS